MLKRKSKYQKMVEIVQEQITQLKRERDELSRISASSTIEVLALEKPSMPIYERFYIEVAWENINNYNKTIREIDNYLESRFNG